MKKLLIFVSLVLLAFCAYAQNIDPELLKRAEAGDAEAQNEIGLIYDRGQNYSKAFEWFLRAAGQGYAYAQNNLGILYDLGQGVEQNYKQAFEWYLKAAEQGLANAQHNLGVLYSQGQGVDDVSGFVENVI